MEMEDDDASRVPKLARHGDCFLFDGANLYNNCNRRMTGDVRTLADSKDEAHFLKVSKSKVS